jgi:MFS family permease
MAHWHKWCNTDLRRAVRTLNPSRYSWFRFLRCLIAASFITSWGVLPVQILDGIGAGLQSVVVPGLVDRVLNGTGRINVGLGAVMTLQNIGAALSPTLGGYIAQGFGYRPTFLMLGALSLGSLVIWLLAARTVKSASLNTAPNAAP